MISSLTLQNLAAYMTQIAGITVIAELLMHAVPVAAAGFRYAYWRLVLVTALAMPWLLRGAPPEAPASVAAAATGPLPLGPVQELPIASLQWAGGAPDWPVILSWVFAAGFLARVLWVAAGLLRLRALRRRAATVTDPVYQEIQQLLGTSAELRSVTGLPQPVTFGVLRPVVLLPGDLAASEELRRAVVTHELVHVQRRDWMWVMAEEALRAVLWFHPAVWWLTSRVQLSREEFTDHLTVLATGSRRAYMEALLAFSEDGALDPAPAFARRGHLFHRIVMISKEAAMSSRRIILSGAVIAVLFATGGWYVSEAVPVVRPPVLRAASPADAQLPAAQAPQVNSVTPENPIPRRLYSVPIPYPPELVGTNFAGAVEMTVVLNASGSVASATRGASAISLGGGRSAGAAPTPQGSRVMEAFGAAASAGIRQWQYDPPAKGPLQFYVVATFTPGEDAVISQSDRSRGVAAGRGVARAVTPSEQAQFSASVKETQDSLRQLAAETGGVPAAAGAVRVGGQVMAPQQVRKVNPVYPPIAMSARVQGVVILEILINEQGRVANAKVLRSIPLLDQAALEAVHQWEYTPTLLNGAPVPVIMTATVEFRLDQ